jgi:hypothetical protein
MAIDVKPLSRKAVHCRCDNVESEGNVTDPRDRHDGTQLSPIIFDER